ncbi:MAG: aldehyde dehydrogenase [Desulfobacteraceae bacterium]|nr:aldehyde dehydrogenase [Desulfobacteraceae bacterium]
MENKLVSYDPSNGEIVGSVITTDIQEIQHIVEQSHTASVTWEKMDISDRVKLLHSAYSNLEPKINDFSILLAREMGKDIQRAGGEVSGTVYGGPYIAKDAEIALKTIDVGDGSRIEYRTLGVAAVISPWNYPLAMANNLIVPALIAGNTIVFKPSEETPLIAHEFVKGLNKILPKGVLQIVHGNGKQGKALVESDVNIIAFTGSQAVGKDIMKRASGELKRLVMELGGNDPMIVMHNANIEMAARYAVASSFENAGQMCTSTERIYVDQKVADEFEQRVVEIASIYKTGPWNMENVNIGPIINADQHRKIIKHIRDAEQKGARVLLGGSEQPERYINPTVICDMTKDMVMEQEETFGPVVAISRYENIEEAIQRANDSKFGLGATVFGGIDAESVADRLQAGMIGINQGVGGSGNTPWVGAKQSGFGFHGSADGHRQFAQVRVLSK